MPGSIRIADIQPPVTAPLLLQVNLGKKEYCGNIGQDGFSFPVTSLRDSMVMSLYDADKELLSKTEVKTRSIVELGSAVVVFNLDSGAEIILQLEFLLSDEDRKRIQEMRNSAVKRKQQELLGNGNELYFQDSPLRKDFPSKEDQPTLRKSLLLADLKERATSVHPDLAAPEDPPPPPPPGSGRNTWTPEGRVDLGSKKVQAKPGSRSSSAVKKMISAFEGSSPQALPSVPRIKSDSSLEGMVSVPSHQPLTPGVSAQTGLVPGAPGESSIPVPSADTVSSSSSGRRAMSIIGDKKPSASRQAGPSNTHVSRRWGSSRRDGVARQSMGANDTIHPEKRSAEKRRRRSMSTYSSPEQQTNRSASTSSVAWISHPHLCITTASRQLKDIVDLEHLNSMKKVVQQNERGETEQGARDDDADCKRRRDGFPALNGWLINQGVRGVIVVIACGAVFLNNR